MRDNIIDKHYMGISKNAFLVFPILIHTNNMCKISMANTVYELAINIDIDI